MQRLIDALEAKFEAKVLDVKFSFVAGEDGSLDDADIDDLIEMVKHAEPMSLEEYRKDERLNQPALYILMRTDMDSMNAGKAMAQAAHAANAFAAVAGHLPDNGYSDWACSTDQWFGTTLVLAVNTERELHEIIDAAQEDGFISGAILDPTYPVRDGKVVHLIPVVTCGYVFTPCRIEKRVSALAGLELHP